MGDITKNIFKKRPDPEESSHLKSNATSTPILTHMWFHQSPTKPLEKQTHRRLKQNVLADIQNMYTKNNYKTTPSHSKLTTNNQTKATHPAPIPPFYLAADLHSCHDMVNVHFNPIIKQYCWAGVKIQLWTTLTSTL